MIGLGRLVEPSDRPAAAPSADGEAAPPPSKRPRAAPAAVAAQDVAVAKSNGAHVTRPLRRQTEADADAGAGGGGGGAGGGAPHFIACGCHGLLGYALFDLGVSTVR